MTFYNDKCAGNACERCTVAQLPTDGDRQAAAGVVNYATRYVTANATASEVVEVTTDAAYRLNRPEHLPAAIGSVTVVAADLCN